jgi:predicted metal-dependent hydrolase
MKLKKEEYQNIFDGTLLIFASSFLYIKQETNKMIIQRFIDCAKSNWYDFTKHTETQNKQELANIIINKLQQEFKEYLQEFSKDDIREMNIIEFKMNAEYYNILSYLTAKVIQLDEEDNCSYNQYYEYMDYCFNEARYAKYDI